jgi:Ca2+-binding RTX toxin-like protein
MARIDASFGPTLLIGYQADRLPTFSNAKLTYSDSSEIDVQAYAQVFAGIAGASTAPFSEGEWIPVEITYTGSFSYKTIRKGRKRFKQLAGGTVYSSETWYGDDYWVEISGFAVSFADLQASGSTTASMYAYEQRLLAGGDSIIGSKFNDLINGLGGNDNIDGSAGDDVIYGGDGDDTIKGAAGLDVLRGDAGRDKFVLNNGDGHATIYGYEPGYDSIDSSSLYPSLISRQEGDNLWLYSGSDVVAVLMANNRI